MAVPVITNPGTQKSNVGVAITPFKIKVSSGTPLTAPKWTNPKIVPPNITLTEVGEEYEVAGTPTEVKTTTVGIVAHNAEGNSVEATFTWEVLIDVPVVTKPANQNTGVGASVSLSVVASGAPTVYAATGLPAGLSINTTTGVISGVPQTPTQTEAAVKVKAENAGGPSSEVSFGWKIVQGQAEANALAAKTPQAGWVAPPLWPALHG